MADYTKFRTALNGFNRADVCAYIEASSGEHQALIAKLQKQLEEADGMLRQANQTISEKEASEKKLRQELEAAKKEAEAAREQTASAQKELEEQTAMSNDLLQQLDETETALKATQKALEETMTPDEVSEEPAAGQEPEEEAPDYASLELEAYRRAEAMERLSAERSSHLRQALNSLLDQVSSRYEQTGQEIQVLAEDIRTNLSRLNEAMSDLDVIFDETAARFDDMDADDLDEE